MFFGKIAGLKLQLDFLSWYIRYLAVMWLFMPIIIVIVYHCWAERCLKDPTPVRTQMLSPPRTTCISCARRLETLEPTASQCVCGGGTALGSMWVKLIGAESSWTHPLSSLFPLSAGYPSSLLPFTLPVTSPGSVTSITTGVLKLLAMACEIKVVL